MPAVLVFGIVLLGMAWPCPSFASGPDNGATTVVGSMGSARKGHTATRLPDGRVLIAGGYGSGDIPARDYGELSSAELFDPATGRFIPTGSMGSVRGYHAATLLRNGKVLVARDNSAELYDPSAGTFTPTGPMTRVRRSGFTATLLRDGRVLVAGGKNIGGDEGGDASQTAELYDPSTGTFSPATGPLVAPRIRHTATLLRDGMVLLAGGEAVASAYSAELFDPASGRFEPLPTLMASFHLGHAATLLRDGKVLFSGGIGAGRQELYDPGTRTFSRSGPHGRSDRDFTATPLPDGTVLFAGGHFDTGMLWIQIDDVMAWDPATGVSAHASPMGGRRLGHTATQLSDGRILFAGGGEAGHRGRVFASAELYDPEKRMASAGAGKAFEPGVGWRAARSKIADLCRDGKLLAVIGHEYCTAQGIDFEHDGRTEDAVVARVFKENRFDNGAITRTDTVFLRTARGEITQLGEIAVRSKPVERSRKEEDSGVEILSNRPGGAPAGYRYYNVDGEWGRVTREK